MNVMQMFHAAAQQQPAPAAQAAPTPGQIPPNGGANGAPAPGTAPNGTVPGDGTPGKPASSPLDNFTDLWQNAPTDPTQPQNIFKIDQKKLIEASQRLNFTNSITPEQLAAITAGGEAAQKAFAEAMNAVAQGVYAQSAFATGSIVEQALKRAQEQQDARLPSMIKSMNVRESLQQENPIFSHPAAAPLIQAIQQQLTVKFPGATAAETKEMAMSYLQNFAEGVTPKKVDTAATTKGEPDWEKLMLG